MIKYVSITAVILLVALGLAVFFVPADAFAQEGSINALSARDLRSDNLVRQREAQSVECPAASAGEASAEPDAPLTPEKTSVIKNYLKLNRDAGRPVRGSEDSKLWSKNLIEPIPEENVRAYLDFVEEAVCDMINGKIGESLKALEKAVKIDPNRPEAYYNAGLAYFHSGRDPLAIMNFRRAIDLRPNFAEARNNLGVSLIRAKLMDAGIEQLRLANIYAPTMREPIDNLERMKYKDTQYNYNDKLVRTGQQAVTESSPARIFSLDLRVCSPLATIPGGKEELEKEERQRDADGRYISDVLSAQEKKALKKRYPNLFNAMSNLVEIPNRQNKYWDALNLVKVADELCAQKLYGESINYYDRVIRMIPEDNSEIYYKRGMAKFNMKSFKAAERDFRIAIKNTYDNAVLNEATKRLEDCRRVIFNIRDVSIPNSSL